ncbi:MAG: molecular chaperone [Glaciihabitans sp.]|nr:molecular chaperone [Glaciihabitans sp.]
MTVLDLPRTLAQLEAIDLAELTERASLQTRVDRKYLVPRAALDAVLGDVSGNARVLEIDGIRGFGYESVYFDTPQLTSYLMAAHKRRRRFKIRTRSYLDTAECYLEVKSRGGRSVTVKDRLEYNLADRAVLTPAGQEYTKTVLAESGIPLVDPAGFRPVLTTGYRRSTLYLPDSDSRATIDLDPTWRVEKLVTADGAGRLGLSGSADLPPLLELPALTIVETKSGSTPSGIDRLLWSHGFRPEGISKFATGMAAMNPQLPANKWARIIRRHFAAESSTLPPAS